MLDLLKGRRARKAAVATIAPLVEGSRNRLNGIAEMAWLDPYMVGFMSMLITLVAHRTGALGTAALANVQTGAWADITGLEGSLVGEEIVLLSSAQDDAFSEGCGNALAFYEALFGGSASAQGTDSWENALEREGPPESVPRDLSEAETGGVFADALWREYFEARIN